MNKHDELLARLDSNDMPPSFGYDTQTKKLAATAIRELRAAVLAEGGAREPVAWMFRWKDDGQLYGIREDAAMDSYEEREMTITPLYAATIAPPPAVSPAPDEDRGAHRRPDRRARQAAGGTGGRAQGA